MLLIWNSEHSTEEAEKIERNFKITEGRENQTRGFLMTDTTIFLKEFNSTRRLRKLSGVLR
jgi:hypothetical protein